MERLDDGKRKAAALVAVAFAARRVEPLDALLVAVTAGELYGAGSALVEDAIEQPARYWSDLPTAGTSQAEIVGRLFRAAAAMGGVTARDVEMIRVLGGAVGLPEGVVGDLVARYRRVMELDWDGEWVG
jgi:hypothetical protein